MSNDLTLNLRVRVNNDGTAPVLGQTSGNIDRVSGSARRAAGDLRIMDSAAASVTRTLGSLVGAYSLYNLAEKIIRDTATVQDLDTRLHTLTKTAGDYAKTVGYIDTVADKQHKKINDLADGYAKLRNLQNSGLITAGRTKEFFEGLNDAASALGVGNDQLKQTFFGLSQSLGLLNAENFNQVMEPIPGLLQEMDKAARLPAGGFKNLVNEGKATVAFFSDTLAKALHTFDGAAAATANNINAKSTDISNSWTRLITKMEQPISVNLNPVLDDINSLLKTMAEFNGSALVEGIITLGEIGVTVFAGKLVVSIGAYLVAKYNAITAEMAHAAALTMDLERTVALTSAELANTSATVASMQATLANTTAMGARMAVANQLNIALLAQAQAQAASAAAMAAQSAAAVTFAGSLKMLLNPINLVNVGLAAMVGWEIGNWLNTFETVRITATATLGAILQGLENVSYYWDRLQIVLSRGGNKDARLEILKEGHLAAKKAIDDNIVSTISYEMSGKKAAESANQLAASNSSVAITAGQSSKEIKEVIKDLEQQIKYQAELAKATNAGIDAQIKDLDRLNTAKAAGLEAERKANDFAYEQHKLSAQAYLNTELALIDKATKAKVDALNQQAALQKTKLDEQVTDVDKAYEAIRMIESKNQAGQVNKSSFALGQGQVLPSTLGMPGFGMAPYTDMAAIEKIKGDYKSLVDYVKGHETELANWGKSYFEHLAVYYKSIPEAVKHYGDGTDAYMSKFMQNVSLINGSTINQIKLAGEQKDIEAEIAKVVAEGQAQKTAAMQKSITESQTYVRALEDERVKLLELTGEATKAREAKAALALERNPAYQQAVASGNTADAKVFTDTNAAEKLNAATAAANAYQDRLDAINKSTKDIGITSTEAFDVINKGFGGLVGTFNSLTDSIDKATNALFDNAKQARDAANDKSLDPKQRVDLAVAYAAKEKALEADRVKTALTGTRQISSAFSQMLDKNSKEYKSAHAVEMALAGAELAMQIMKITGIGAVAAASAASAPVEAGASAIKKAGVDFETWAVKEKMFAIYGAEAAQVQSVGPEVSASIEKATAKGTEDIMAQGSIPIVGFAMMAAMAAVVASFGLRSGSGSISPGPQGMSLDTGTVLGNSSAKSESIDKTYQLLKDIQAQNYPVLKSIDKGISDLHSGITDVITRLYQAGGLTTVNAPASAYKPSMGMIGSSTQAALQFANLPTSFIGMDIDPVSNFLMNGIFGGKQTSAIIAQGIAINETLLKDVINKQNLNARQFAQIETKTEGGWFGKDKFSTTTVYSDLDKKTQKALNDVFQSIGTTVTGLAENLGKSVGADLTDSVNKYVIPALNVDLKGLNGEDAAKKLNGVLSTAIDDMTTTLFGNIVGQYQQLGEGMLETTTRVVTQIAVVEEALSTVGVGISGDVIKVTDDISKFSGGIREFQKNFDAAFDKFANGTEKQNRLTAKLQSQLSGTFTQDQINTLGKTREEFGKLFAAVAAAGNAEQVALLVKLAPAADDWYKYNEEAISKQHEFELNILQIKIDSLTNLGKLTEAVALSEELAAKKRFDTLAELDKVDLSLRSKQIAVWTAEQDAANALLLRSGDSAKALANGLKWLDEVLTTSSLSPAKLSQSELLKNQYGVATQLAAQVSADALNIPDAVGVISGLLSSEYEKLIAGIKSDLIQTVDKTTQNGISDWAGVLGGKLGDAAANIMSSAFSVAATKMATFDLAPSGQGIINVITKRAQLAFVNQSEFIDGVKTYGADVIQYAKTLNAINAAYAEGTIGIVDFTRATGELNKILPESSKLMGNTYEQLQRVAEAGAALSSAGAESITYYFGEISKSVARMAEEAKKANTEIAKTDGVIGRLKSLSTVMTDSVAAINEGMSASSAALQKQLEIASTPEEINATQRSMAAMGEFMRNVSDDMNKASLVGSLALQASQQLTTQSAKEMATQLETINSFKGVGTTKLRDISLMLDGVSNFNNAKFEDAFLKITDAFKKGTITTEQYMDMYNLALDVTTGKLSSVTSGLTDAAKAIQTWQDKLDVLNGTITQKALDRRNQIDGEKNPAVQDLMRQVFAKQDAVDLAKAQHAMEISLLEAQGNAIGALAVKRQDELSVLDAALVPLQKAIYAAQDKTKSDALQVELLNAQGKTATALIFTRSKEIDALSATDAAIKQQIYTAQDLAKTRSLEIELLNAQKQSTQALAMSRADELKGLSAADAVIKRQIYAAQDASTAVSGAFAVLQKSVDAEKKAISDKYNANVATTQTAVDSLTTSVGKLSGVATALKNAVNGMPIPGSEAVDRASAQAAIKAALITAQAGGGMIDESVLNQALGVIAKPSEQLFASFLDYQNDFVTTKNDIATLSDLADRQLSKGTSQLDVLKSQLDTMKKGYDDEITRLDGVLSTAQSQIDAVNGTTIAVMSVKDAIAGLANAISAQAALQPQTVANTGAVVTSPSGLSSIGNSAATYDLPAIATQLAQVAGIDVVNSLASGTALIAAAHEYKLPGFAVGTNFVPGDMAANIHYGERIIPAADNRELMMRLSAPAPSNTDYAELVAEVKRLREVVERQEKALNNIDTNTGNTANNTKSTDLVFGRSSNGQPYIMVKSV